MTTVQAYAAKEAKAALEPFTFELSAEVPAGHVDIDVELTGVCHSDVCMVDNDWGFSAYPIVPGHEVIGVVRAVGADVTSLKPGMRVGVGWHSGYCNACEFCGAGDQNLCGKTQPTIAGHHGGFAKVIRSQAIAAVPIPEGMDSAQVGPLLCGGITVFNPLVQYNVKPTDRVAVVGIGGLGHLALQFLKAWGCRVTAFTSTAAKAEEAKGFGATDIISSTDPEAIKAAAGTFDYIFVTASNASLPWADYITALRPKGRLHMLGAIEEPIPVAVFPLLVGQKQISASPVGSPGVIAQMLRFAQQHKIAAQVELHSFDDVNKVMDVVRAGKAKYRAVLKW